MKSMTRSRLWWSQLDAAAEDIARFCNTCQHLQPNPTSAPLHSWSWTSTPWDRVLIDIAKLDGTDFLILVDAHSNCLEAIYMSHSTTAQSTIQALRKRFATDGFPAELVPDNGPLLTSEEFATFVKQNGKRIFEAQIFIQLSLVWRNEQCDLCRAE